MHHFFVFINLYTLDIKNKISTIYDKLSIETNSNNKTKLLKQLKQLEISLDTDTNQIKLHCLRLLTLGILKL